MAAYAACVNTAPVNGLAECGGGTQLLRSDSAGSCCAAIGPQPAQLDLRAWLLVADARGCVLGVVICVALASTRTLCLRAWAAPVHIDTGFKPCRHDMRVQPLLPLSY